MGVEAGKQRGGQATPSWIAKMNRPSPSQIPLQKNAAANPAKADVLDEALVVFIASSWCLLAASCGAGLAMARLRGSERGKQRGI